MSTPEGRIKAKVKRRFRDEFGDSIWPFWPVQTGYGSVALDLLACICGRFIAIETKAYRTKKLTPLQQTTSTSIRLAGGLVFIVYDDASLDHAVASIKLALEFDSEQARSYRDGKAAAAAGEREEAHQATRGDHGAPGATSA